MAGPSISNLPLGAVVQTLRRRLLIIPVLFISLILISAVYIMSSLDNTQRDTATLEVITRQRILRNRYLNQIFLVSQGIPSRNYQSLIYQSRQYLEALQQGSMARTTFGQGSTLISSPPSEEISRELQRKQRLLNRLESETGRLLSLPRGSREYQASLNRLAKLIDDFEETKGDLVSLYLLNAREKLNRRMLMALLLILITGGVGILLTRQQAHANQILIQSEEYFRQIFDAAPIGKTLIDPEGQWLRVNPPFWKLLGCSQDELLKLTLPDITEPSDLAAEKKLQAKLISGEVQTYQLNKRLIHRDGHFIWTLATGGALRDQNNRTLAIVVHHLDITEQRATLEALQGSEARYRNIFESAMNGIIIAGLDGHVLSANRYAHQIFQYLPGELIGQNLTLLMPKRYRNAHLAGMQRLAETRVPRLSGKTLELSGIRKDGSEFPVELTLSVWEDPQKNMFCTGLIQDITARRQSEEERTALRRSNRALGEFSRIATHDLQEPLRKIGFYTELVATKEKDKLDGESLQYAQKILSSIDRMQSLIRDLILYSEVSLEELNITTVDLNQVVHSITQELRPQIEASGALVQSDSLPIIAADRKLIHHLFKEVILNGLKFCRNGVSPVIHIYGSLLNKDTFLGQAEFAEIRVQDNGIGFDRKYLDRIFGVFQRLHAPGEYTGTGIGLATCKRIVEQHHGSITASSEPGVGSTITITLPVWQNNIEETGKFQ